MSESSHDPRFVQKTFLALLALALISRLWRLFELDVWFDEVVLLFQAQMSFVEIWEFSKGENYPPLYPWLLKLWGYLIPGETGGRLLSAIIGAFVPPLAFVLGNELADKKMGLFLALAVMISLPLYYFSQVIRMYSLFVLLALISYYALVRALKADRGKYWLLLTISNLLNFYNFLLTVFIILSQFLVLIWFYRLDLRKYLRPLAYYLPTLLLMGFWVFTMLNRFQIYQGYTLARLEAKEVLNAWLYLGSGLNFHRHYLLAILLNLPFLVGVILGFRKWNRNPSIQALGLLFLFTIANIMGISVLYKSFFHTRYLIFCLPLYLVLALYGWKEMEKKLWRTLGLASVFLILLGSFLYYNIDHMAVHDYYRYHGLYKTSPQDDGRSVSRLSAQVQKHLAPGEVVLHYSALFVRTFSFFTAQYYDQRSRREYIYSREPLLEYAGRQYLLPGQRISRLSDFKPLPQGIWVFTLEPPSVLDYEFVLKSIRENTWVYDENLAQELYQTGYRQRTMLQDGGTSAIHFILNHSAANLIGATQKQAQN